MSKCAELLRNEIGTENVYENENMGLHTSFKTGGNAQLYIEIQSVDELVTVIRILKEQNVPFYIMGNGSNLLVRDRGFKGAVIQTCKKMNHIQVEDSIINAQSGALLSNIAVKALEHSLTGFEFASGIPGSLGGAVCMNAGAYDGEMKNVIVSADILTEDLKVKTYNVNELQLGYRRSILTDSNMIVLNSKIQLSKGNKEEIAARVAYLTEQRKEKQPLNYPSAGSTFKRPVGYFAGKLITDSGLKGFRIGGAQVSQKHAGFVINAGGATAEDILNLIAHCQKTVFEKFGVKLEPEVKIIGEK